MSNAVVAAWTACIKDLEQHLGAAASAPPGAPSSIHETRKQELIDSVLRLQKQPPLPHAAWKRLVQDVKVWDLLGCHTSCDMCTAERRAALCFIGFRGVCSPVT
jgi:hypothetical protein